SRNKCRPTVRGCAQCGYATPPCPYRESNDHYRRALSSPALWVCPPRTDQTTIQSWNLAAVDTYPCKRSGRNPDHDCSEPFGYRATTAGACKNPSVFVTYLYASSSCSML